MRERKREREREKERERERKRERESNVKLGCVCAQCLRMIRLDTPHSSTAMGSFLPKVLSGWLVTLVKRRQGLAATSCQVQNVIFLMM